MTNPPASRIKYLVRQPSLWIALVIWFLLSGAAIVLCRNGVPLDRPELAGVPPITDVLNNSVGLFMIILLIGIVALLARRRPFPHLAERAPERWTALRETLAHSAILKDGILIDVPGAANLHGRWIDHSLLDKRTSYWSYALNRYS